MITLINRFSKYSIVIFGFLAITLSHAQDERTDDISILDVDANGKVDALTDGLLILRSMFELTDDALVTGVVDSVNCKECDAEGIDQYLSTVKVATYGKLNANDDQNISGSGLSGTTLTIGIEDGTSETVDLSSLEDGTGITADQASAITDNTAKVGITSVQSDAILTNTEKVGISSNQASAITDNTAKQGITSDQAAAITANTEKVGTDDQNISGLTLDGTTLTIGIERGGSDSIDLAALVNCSVTQDGSRAIISCNDGTSAVLASAGTVVTYPAGQSPPVDIGEFPTGEVVIIDAGNVVLARLYFESGDNYYAYLNQPDETFFVIVLTNDHVTSSVKISSELTVYFNELDCTGESFSVSIDNFVIEGPNSTYYAQSSQTQKYSQILKSSYDYSSGTCVNQELATANARTVFPYYPADEILNAAYPISLDQLP